MGKREHEEEGQDNNMFRHSNVENTWLMCVIKRDITNACGRHMRRQKWPDLCVNCRSAENTVVTHTYVHLFVDLKNVVPKCLAFTFLKRGENTWIHVVFNSNGRQKKVSLEMLGSGSVFSIKQSSTPTSINASMWTVDSIYSASSRWTAMGTASGVLSFSGTSCFCPAEHSNRATVSTSTPTRIKSVMPSHSYSTLKF